MGIVATDGGNGGGVIVIQNDSQAVNTPGVTGMAYDSADGILYMSTDGGEVLRWDAAAGTFLSPISVGGDLSSVAVSPDGSFLLVGDQNVYGTYPNNYAQIDRVSLSNLSVQALTLPVTTYEGSVGNVAIAANGQAIFALNGQWPPLGEFAANASQIGSGTVSGATSFDYPNLVTSDEGQYVLIEDTKVDPGEEQLYSSQTDQIVASLSNAGFDYADINEQAGLIAQGYWAITIENLSLGVVTQLQAPNGDHFVGAHFSADGSELFAVDGTTDTVDIYSTQTWNQLGSIQLTGLPSPISSAQMAVSSDGQFLFVQAGGTLESIDLAADLGSTPPAPGYQSGATSGQSATVYTSSATPPVGATTTAVSGAYVVTASQHLTDNQTHSPAFTLETSGSALTVKGSVQLTSSVANLILTGVGDANSGVYSTSITVAQGGSLQVQAKGAGDEALGSNSNSSIENDGAWSVSAPTGDAFGAEGDSFTNTGTFAVSGHQAAGVMSAGGAFTNTGQFTVSGTSGALGASIAGPLSNSGDVTVTTQSGIAVAFELTGLYGINPPVQFQNTGTITAPTALEVYSSSSPTETPIVDLTNSGTINGAIDLGVGFPTAFQSSGQGSQIVNTGAINGAIHLDNGEATYDGAEGTQTGGIYLGSGDDNVILGNDGETVYGGSGVDVIVGGAGNDVINGSASGHTTFSYENASAGVVVNLGISGPQNTGGGGTDTLVNVSDLVGSQFNDILIGSGPNQTLEGGAGDDVLIAGPGNEVLDGGAGNDTAIFAGSASSYTVTTTSSGYQVVGPQGTYELYNIENIVFSDVQVVTSPSGQTLTAVAGGDVLIGGPGNDTFIIGSGTDIVTGGGGTDTAVFSGDYADYTLNPAGATLTVAGDGSSASLSDVAILQFADEQLVISSSGENLTARAGGDILQGGAGNDMLYANTGTDVIDGGGGVNTVAFSGDFASYQVVQTGGTTTVAGNGSSATLTNVQFVDFADAQMILGTTGETLTARAGGDTLIGGAGNDTLIGGTGADTFIVGTGNDTVTGGSGTNTVVFSGDYSAYQIGVDNGVLTVVGPTGTDSLTDIQTLQFADQTINVSSLGSLGQLIIGTSGNDTLTAGSAGTTIYGLAGNDTLKGGAGNDILDGGAGNDILNGGGGINTATYADATSGVTVSLLLTTAQNTGGSGTDTLTNIQNLIGSAYNDVLTAGKSGSVLQGMAGDDTLVGGPGNDTLDGGTGDNTASYALATSAVTVNLELSGAQNTIGAGKDTLINIQNLIGSNYNDTLTAGPNGSSLEGGAGNDTLITGPGTDTLDGGTGTNTAVFSGHAADYTISQTGSATLVTGDGTSATLTNIQVLQFADEQMVLGTAGESITARAAGDTLIGGPGNDTLKGGAGADILDGGQGNDILNGGGGINTATYADATSGVTVNLKLTTAQNTGGAGTDTLTNIQNLIGSAYNDVLTAGSSGSVLQGMAGDDTLVSGPGNDTLDGGTGNNTASYALATSAVTVSLEISGQQNTVGAGKDTLVNIQNLIGSNYNDTLTAGPNGSSLEGGAGNDTLVTGPGTDVLDGGTGTNTAVFSGHAADYSISQNGSATLVTGDGTSATLTNIQVLQFADEQMVLGTAGESITARAAGDTLVGGPGNDTLKGGAGNDILIGGGGNDTINGGGGTNTAVFSGDAASYTVKESGGTTTMKGASGTDTLTNVQVLQFADSEMIGVSTGGTMTARAGGDSLIGGAGNDTLITGSGTDVLNGGAGVDTAVFSGHAADYAISQSGSATLVVGDGTSATLTNVEVLQFADEQVVISAAGQSLVARAAGDTLVGGAGNDSLKGAAGNDVLIGNGGNDTLNGGGGTNTAVFSGDYSSYKLNPASGTVTTVKGPDGTDTLANIQILQFADRQMVNGSTGETLTARPGGDTLVGGAGNDHLIGGAGNDTLIAGTGQDTLTGGGGQDTFVFSAIADSKVSAPDLITDWTPGDLINLSAIDANTAQAGVQAFHFGATATHTGDIVVSYDATHNRTVIDLYDSTSAKPEAEIWLSGNQTLTSSDFIL